MLCRAWPDKNMIDQKWTRLQNSLFELLCGERVVYTQAYEGKWLNVEEAIFDKLDYSEPKELLLKILIQADQPVTTLPSHVLKSIVHWSKSIITEITPSLVRRVLNDYPSCYRSLDRAEKLTLLQFVLDFKDNNFVELLGLELLPIANGAFASFSHSGEAIYIASSEHPQELLPGLSHRFVSQDIGGSLLESLEAVAKEGM